MTAALTIEYRVQVYAAGEYWTGKDCVNLRLPWFTPKALEALTRADVLTFLRDARVLELGSGGSTLFFGDHCKEVLSIETNREWYKKVIEAGLPKNVQMFRSHSADSTKKVIESIAPGGFDVAVIDGDPSVYPRGEMADFVLDMMKPQAIFITDNYYSNSSMVKRFCGPTPWRHMDFNNTYWHGCGTRLSFRGFD